MDLSVSQLVSCPRTNSFEKMVCISDRFTIMKRAPYTCKSVLIVVDPFKDLENIACGLAARSCFIRVAETDDEICPPRCEKNNSSVPWLQRQQVRERNENEGESVQA